MEKTGKDQVGYLLASEIHLLMPDVITQTRCSGNLFQQGTEPGCMKPDHNRFQALVGRSHILEYGFPSSLLKVEKMPLLL